LVGTVKYRRVRGRRQRVGGKHCRIPSREYSFRMETAAGQFASAPSVNRFLSWRLDAQRWTILHLQRLSTTLGHAPRKPRHLLTGERGELEALFFLRRQGYLFVERRWRSPELRGDLDLIGWDGPTLCFVEVKARTARDFAPAQASVDDQKKRMLRRMARAYKRTLPRGERLTIPTRFDVVSVYLLSQDAAPECELVRNAFPTLEDDHGQLF
jgi:putative endonuclease